MSGGQKCELLILDRQIYNLRHGQAAQEQRPQTEVFDGTFWPCCHPRRRKHEPPPDEPRPAFRPQHLERNTWHRLTVVREVVKKILNSLSSQTSYTNIAEEAELGSKNTAIDYLNFLSDSYFLKETKFFDIPQQKVILKKNKKFYTTDPYIVWLFESFVTGSLNFESLRGLVDNTKLTENFIATELTKKSVPFFFYQNSSEMDFYLPNGSIGIEVKYKNKITNGDIKFPNGLNKKIIISQNTLEERDGIFIIPAHLFSLIEL